MAISPLSFLHLSGCPEPTPQSKRGCATRTAHLDRLDLDRSAGAIALTRCLTRCMVGAFEHEGVVKKDERRVHQRIPHEVRVSLGSESNFFTGFTEDIAEGGVFVATESLLPLGTLLRFDLSLGKGSVTAVGEVRWVRETSADSDQPAGIGIRFVGLHSKVRDVINAFIAERRAAIFYDDD